MVRRALKSLAPLALGAAAIAAVVAKPSGARADGDATFAHQRCATRLSVALLGKSASADLLASADPQSQVDAMLADPQFVDRFARFVNSQFNPDPGQSAMEDASYTLAKYILTNGKPWHEMFDGKYDVTDTVTADPNGLGYFRSAPWMMRYEGNEPAGYRIVSANRMMQNLTGLKLVATTKVDGMDVSATTRQSAACAQCHYQNWYALDLVAKILSKRNLAGGANPTPRYLPPNEGPQNILNTTISDDAGLVAALLASQNYKFNTCRLAFEFLYARPENTCEAQMFDKCRDAFDAAGTMQAAVASIAKDPSFCQ